ncbi:MULTISPECIES: restriction endonuclease subunit S [Gammaproteobacteria]|jgi:type I restriction enzyme S subunit|uniref:restriction endonuclease subunit S n=1 Tax=Gammaproteobacteria TaxID=1236 RepID=UPI00192BCA4E|nr:MULTISPECIES: restriction endonuclease subunit S [Gammaproteobacteria]MDF4498228.1 restriction endonuclease subunit S [Vibrio parahaemolyticus]MBL4243723.1 restriction endonuclease subunit S [Vibrio fluvialis]MBL4252444.1 restriction endonuclease subunit S [Vibrio fluvialis]MDG3378314.1 restriction endonuclease subunit S [Vibrio parahaemolyticus]MEB4704477.1 restriction endonuclease subunit S [Klebsiella quasipneumoniae]
MEQVLYKLPYGWEWQAIEEVAQIGADRGFVPTPDSEGNVPFIGMTDIDQETGQKSTYELRKFDDVKKGYTKFQRNAVLFAKITPCTENNKTALIDNVNGGFATTEVFPIHALDSVEPNYLLHFFRSPSVRRFLIDHMEGATGRQRVPLKALKSVSVPVCGLEEQKHIVEKLNALLIHIDTAIEHLQESITLADALYASELACVFNSGQSKWPLRELNEVAEVSRGKSKHRPRNDKSLFGGEYPFIQTGDVRNAQKYITNYSATYNEKGLQQSKLWPKDTICLTIAANIGDVAILGMDACFPDSVVGISSSELETDYLYYFLTTLQQQLDSKANAAAQKNINLKILSEIKIPVPTLDEQKSIVRQINEIDRLAVKAKAEISEKMTMMQQLKASILDSAFKGKL